MVILLRIKAQRRANEIYREIVSHNRAAENWRMYSHCREMLRRWEYTSYINQEARKNERS